MKPVYINSISIAAANMLGLEQATPILSGKENWQSAEFPKLAPQLLPANERRRTTPYLKLALQVADEASENNKQLAAVFASSNGDFQISNTICNTLTMDPKFISPTQFHNSVHNAASGYWAIAANSQAASTSISTGNATFASGLLEAVTQLLVEGKDILYVAYDYPAEDPLRKFTDVSEPFATACVLSLTKSSSSYASIKLTVTDAEQAISDCKNTSLNSLQKCNPIAQSLPVIEALFLKQDCDICLPYLNNKTLNVKMAFQA